MKWRQIEAEEIAAEQWTGSIWQQRTNAKNIAEHRFPVVVALIAIERRPSPQSYANTEFVEATTATTATTFAATTSTLLSAKMTMIKYYIRVIKRERITIAKEQPMRGINA